MKKLILSAAIILGSLSTISAQAQDQSTTPSEQTTPASEAATPQTGYSEIKVEEVPSAITEALTKAYPEAVITKAYINEKQQYKLDIKVGEKEETLFADATGKWMEN